jgi:hypothetical protein
MHKRRYDHQENDDAHLLRLLQLLEQTQVYGEVEDIAEASREEIRSLFLGEFRTARTEDMYTLIWQRWIRVLSEQYFLTGVGGDLEEIRRVASEIEIQNPASREEIEQHIAALEANRAFINSGLFLLPCIKHPHLFFVWEMFRSPLFPNFVNDLEFDALTQTLNEGEAPFQLLYAYQKIYQNPGDKADSLTSQITVEESRQRTLAEEKLRRLQQETARRLSFETIRQMPADTPSKEIEKSFFSIKIPDEEMLVRVVEHILSEPERFWFTEAEREAIFGKRTETKIEMGLNMYMGKMVSDGDTLTEALERYGAVLRALMYPALPDTYSLDQIFNKIRPELTMIRCTETDQSDINIPTKTSRRFSLPHVTLERLTQETERLKHNLASGHRLTQPEEIEKTVELFVRRLQAEEREYEKEALTKKEMSLKRR